MQIPNDLIIVQGTLLQHRTFVSFCQENMNKIHQNPKLSRSLYKHHRQLDAAWCATQDRTSHPVPVLRSCTSSIRHWPWRIMQIPHLWPVMTLNNQKQPGSSCANGWETWSQKNHNMVCSVPNLTCWALANVICRFSHNIKILIRQASPSTIQLQLISAGHL